MRFSNYLAELKQLIQLAYPIFFAQIALTGLGFLDTLMSGWVGREDLAAIGLGSSIFMPVFMVGTGLLLAITPLIGQASGQKDVTKMTQILAQGLWLAFPLAVLSVGLLLQSDALLSWLALEPKVTQLTWDYLRYIGWGLPAILLYQTLRFFWEGQGRTLPTMFISFMALILNIPLNLLFIYGVPGWIEAHGAAGCGIASALVMWTMLGVGAFYVWRHHEMGDILQKAIKQPPSWHLGSRQILKIGVPNTLALLFEVSLFSFIALFVAQLGTLVLASHQVAISYTSMAFMLPMSFAMAVTVRISWAYGAKETQTFNIILKTSYLLSLGLGLFLAVITYFGQNFWVSLYTEDIEIRHLAALLLVYAASYQVFDAIQATSAGILRGLGETQFTMWVTLICYWGIGLFGGYLLGLTSILGDPMGVEGFWLAIVIALGSAALLLSWRVWQRTQTWSRNMFV